MIYSFYLYIITLYVYIYIHIIYICIYMYIINNKIGKSLVRPLRIVLLMICWGVRQGRPRNAKGDAALPNGSVLVGLGVSKIGPQKLITFHVLVPIWFQFGSNLVPIRFFMWQWRKGVKTWKVSLFPETRPKIWPPSSPRHPGFKLQLWHMQLQTWRRKHGRIEMQ